MLKEIINENEIDLEKVYESRNLGGSHRCHTLRNSALDLQGTLPIPVKRTIITKNALLAFMLARAMAREKHFEEKYRYVFCNFIMKRMPIEDIPSEWQEKTLKLLKVLSIHTDNPMLIGFNDIGKIIRETCKIKKVKVGKDGKKNKFKKEIPALKKYIFEEYQKLDDLTARTKMLQTRKAYNKVKRYLLSEKRWPKVLTSLDKKELNLHGVKVMEKPDVIFYEDDGAVIEAAKFFLNDSDVKTRGKTRETKAAQNLELYSKFVYARGLISDDHIHEVKASFYSLKRADDKKGNFNEDYYAPTTTHIATIGEMTFNEELTKEKEAKAGIPLELQNNLDGSFVKLFEEFIKGEDCKVVNKDICEKCDLKEFCEFAEAPIPTAVPKEGKKIADISLSGQQQRAVDFRKGIARILAGAGCGKTLVIALRTAFMLSEGIKPEEILLITFTNAGAGEMKERIAMYDEDLMNDSELEKLTCTTFNAWGNEIIKKEYLRFGFTDVPRIIDEIEKKALITELLDKNVVKELRYENFLAISHNYHGALIVTLKAFEIIKRKGYTKYDVDKFLEEIKGELNNVKDADKKDVCLKLLALYEVYDEAMRDRNLIEYQDQEALIFELLEDDPYYLDNEFKYKHIIVDEFQDTSENQLEILKNLIDMNSFESLFVVGDDSQTIYEFRDAVTENLVDLEKKLGKTVNDFKITENHRSTPEIIDFANKVVEKNTLKVEKELVATRPSGKPVEAEGFYTEEEMLEYIEEVVESKLNDGFSKEDIAILAFTKKELIKIQGRLAKAGIETSLRSEEPLLENSRVQGIISFARAVSDNKATKDILSYRNCLDGGNIITDNDADELKEIIEKELQYLEDFSNLEYTERVKEFDKMIFDIAKDDEIAINFAERLEKRRKIGEKIKYVEDFIRFGGEGKKREGKFSGVVLSTAHGSKGLEWPVIINVISEYDKKDLVSVKNIESARRLLFVSSTRARDELYVLSTFRVGKDEASKEYINNRFLKESFEAIGKEFKPMTRAEEELKKAAEKKKANEEKKRKREEAKAKKEAEKAKKKAEAKAKKEAEKKKKANA